MLVFGLLFMFSLLDMLRGLGARQRQRATSQAHIDHTTGAMEARYQELAHEEAAGQERRAILKRLLLEYERAPATERVLERVRQIGSLAEQVFCLELRELTRPTATGEARVVNQSWAREPASALLELARHVLARPELSDAHRRAALEYAFGQFVHHPRAQARQIGRAHV